MAQQPEKPRTRCNGLSNLWQTCTGFSKGSSVSKFPDETNLLTFKYWLGRQNAFGHNPTMVYPQFLYLSVWVILHVWVGRVLCLTQRIKSLQDQRCSHQNVCLSSWKAQRYVPIQFDSTTPLSKRERNRGLQVQTLAPMNEHLLLLQPLTSKWQRWVRTLPRQAEVVAPPPAALAGCLGAHRLLLPSLCAKPSRGLQRAGDGVAPPKSTKHWRVLFDSIPCHSWGVATNLGDEMSPANEF